MEDDCAVLDFSEEFLNYNKNDEKIKNNIINCIVNTLTELTEVNKVKGKELCISTQNSKVALYVVPTNEELMIARDTYELVK